MIYLKNLWKKLKKKDVIIYVVGNKLDKIEEKEKFVKLDKSGRLILSKKNASLIKDITSKLNEYC